MGWLWTLQDININFGLEISFQQLASQIVIIFTRVEAKCAPPSTTHSGVPLQKWMSSWKKHYILSCTTGYTCLLVSTHTNTHTHTHINEQVWCTAGLTRGVPNNTGSLFTKLLQKLYIHVGHQRFLAASLGAYPSQTLHYTRHTYSYNGGFLRLLLGHWYSIGILILCLYVLIRQGCPQWYIHWGWCIPREMPGLSPVYTCTCTCDARTVLYGTSRYEIYCTPLGQISVW